MKEQTIRQVKLRKQAKAILIRRTAWYNNVVATTKHWMLQFELASCQHWVLITATASPACNLSGYCLRCCCSSHNEFSIVSGFCGEQGAYFWLVYLGCLNH